MSIAQPTAAPRLSIVVLPFANRSNDPEQQYFADSITEDVTTDLSRLGGMLVISCNTAFTYRDKSIDTKQIGRELGVRYVLEGSIRRSGSQVRVSTQLIDAETDAHLWAERFHRDIDDLFALQDEVTSRIAIALKKQTFPDRIEPFSNAAPEEGDESHQVTVAAAGGAQARLIGEVGMTRIPAESGRGRTS
jgi:adenylate cyclase